MSLRSFIASAPLLLLPEVASAQVLTKIAGVFNIFVGLMLVTAFLLYFGSLVGWFARRGVFPGYRDDMIHLMQWSVVVLFVLVVLLALIHFVQIYQADAAFVFGIFLFCLIVWLILKAATSKPAKQDDH